MQRADFVRTTCKLCQASCGMLVYMENGVPKRIEGDPDYPANEGVICDKGKASLEFLHSSYRLLHPMKRIGGKGEGKWQRISWDEALTTVAAELTRIKESHGAKAVAFTRGWAKGLEDLLQVRFANVFGSPNVLGMGSVCYQPKAQASTATYGFLAYPDYENGPACTVIWGLNPYSSSIMEQIALEKAIARGTKLISIDPAETEVTRRSSLWIRPRPGTDLALALGMIYVIVNEELYDKEFVDKWTVGFDQLKDHVQAYSPEKVADITWVAANDIIEVSRVYATHRPAVISSGNGIESGLNNFQTLRAIAILRSITGNIGIPGGEISFSSSGVMSRNSAELLQEDKLPPDILARSLNAQDKFFGSHVLPQSIKKAMVTPAPYRIRAAFVQGANLLLSWCNSNETFNALNKLDFMVVLDIFMTPTAELADIVLPVGTFLEIDTVSESLLGPYAGVTQKVTQVGEAWSIYEAYKGLAEKMGFGQYFPKEKDFLDFLVAPAGISFDEFRRVRVLYGSRQYRTYEKSGFNTSSGQIELYSKKLEEKGFDPVPVYYEPPESPYSDTELAKKYPFVLTSRKVPYFTHSGYRQIGTLRSKHSDPVVYINRERAKQLNIQDGESVCIETKRGTIKQKAALVDTMDPRVIVADFGWWFPEKGIDEDIHGARESNINMLTDDKEPFSREIGSPILRGILCKVYKAS